MALTYDQTDEPLAFDTRTGHTIYFRKSQRRGDEDEEGMIPEPDKYVGHLEIVPKNGKVQGRENDLIYITGASGGGKSYVARTFACNYHRMFPKNKIYYFTMSDESKLPDSEKVWMAKMPDSEVRYHTWMDLKRYHVDSTLLNHKFDLENDFAKSLVIFDDFMYFESGKKKENEELMEFIISHVLRILNLGRKIRVSCIITSHLIYEQKNPDLYKNIFGEVHKFIWCVNKVAERQLLHALKTHFGLENEEIRRARKFDPNSHYVCFNKFPKCLQSENRIELL